MSDTRREGGSSRKKGGDMNLGKKKERGGVGAYDHCGNRYGELVLKNYEKERKRKRTPKGPGQGHNES